MIGNFSSHVSTSLQRSPFSINNFDWIIPQPVSTFKIQGRISISNSIVPAWGPKLKMPRRLKVQKWAVKNGVANVTRTTGMFYSGLNTWDGRYIFVEFSWLHGFETFEFLGFLPTISGWLFNQYSSTGCSKESGWKQRIPWSFDKLCC